MLTIMSQADLDVLEGKINDYKRTDELFNQRIAFDMLETLSKIYTTVLPEDQDLFRSAVEKLKEIAYPPVPIVPVPPPINPADITPLLNEIMTL